MTDLNADLDRVRQEGEDIQFELREKLENQAATLQSNLEQIEGLTSERDELSAQAEQTSETIESQLEEIQSLTETVEQKTAEQLEQEDQSIISANLWERPLNRLRHNRQS